jgi:hypothetical protein
MSNLRKAAEQALYALEAMQSYAASERKGLRICDEAIPALRAALAEPDEVAAAVAAEREACAKKAERWDAFHPDSNYGHCIAKLIRERWET